MGKSDIFLEVRTENDVDVISINGQLDTFGARDISSELKKLTDARHYNLVLDFRGVNYVNSAAIGAIVGMAQHVRKRKGDLRIFGMKQDIHTVFSIVGASKILEIFETEQEALNSFVTG